MQSMSKHSTTYNRWWLPLKLAFYIIIPVVLLLLPVDYFDTGQSVCISKLLLDLECYGCGMTRAVMHLIHFDVIGAWEFNKLVFIVLPLLMWVWLSSFLKDYKWWKAIKELS